jgi:hypothetical protein
MIAAVLLATVAGFSQKAVLLHKTNGTQQAFYSSQPLADAYNAAGNGDTIYVPGGFFSPVNIDKRLKLYGAGHYPDSTQATGTTILTGGFNIYDNADSTLVEGFQVNGNILVIAGSAYVKIRRNRIGVVTIAGNFGQVDGNVLNSISGGGDLNLLISNNIIETYITSCGNGTVVRNNLFLSEYYPLYSPGNTYVLFENNIFSGTNASWNYNDYSTFNTFTKNVFYITPNWGNNAASGNYLGQSNVFVSQSGFTFNYAHNYHLQNPGNYPGVDATQCGIYGGMFIYKEGAVPANPHIISKTISATTDAQGKLNATIKVAAQNN